MGGVVAALSVETVQALVRSEREEYPSYIEHDYIDFTNDVEDWYDIQKSVRAGYDSTAAYLQKDTDQATWDVNGTSSSCANASIAARKSLSLLQDCITSGQWT